MAVAVGCAFMATIWPAGVAVRITIVGVRKISLERNIKVVEVRS